MSTSEQETSNDNNNDDDNIRSNNDQTRSSSIRGVFDEEAQTVMVISPQQSEEEEEGSTNDPEQVIEEEEDTDIDCCFEKEDDDEEDDDKVSSSRTRSTTAETHLGSSSSIISLEENDTTTHTTNTVDEEQAPPPPIPSRQPLRQRANTSGSAYYIDDLEVLAQLQPPMGTFEVFRDQTLRLLDRTIFQLLGILVLIGVVADGAFFFFLLMGWQRMCDDPSKTDCDPRNWWYNWSIQVLNVLFTYMAVVSLPWRVANFLHLTGTACPRRSRSIGHNLYGLPDPEVWFHVPVGRRLGITTILIGNCVFQFINQGTRIWYAHFDAQNTSPGNIWTNVFFAASFACAAAAGLWLLYESKLLRRRHPDGRFGPGPVEAMKQYYHTHVRRRDDPSSDDEEIAQLEAAAAAAREERYVDPTRDPHHRVLIGDNHDRAAMRLWAL